MILNRQPINKRAITSNAVALEEFFATQLTGFLSSGAVYELSETMNSTLTGKVQPARGIPLEAVYQTGLSGSISVNLAYTLEDEWSSQLGGAIILGGAIGLLEALQTSLSGASLLGGQIGLLETYRGFLTGEMVLGAVIQWAESLYSVLEGHLDIFNTKTISTIADVVIPPGGTLVVDAANYTMLLDNQNVIDKHSGDWIWVSRDTVSIEVSAAGLKNEMEVYFIARYL